MNSYELTITQAWLKKNVVLKIPSVGPAWLVIHRSP